MSEKQDIFEKNIDRLQQIVEKLESGDSTLDASVSLYKEVMVLAAACRKQLDKARLTVNKVTPDGMTPFNPGDGSGAGEEN